jgi:hypothetical protein
MAAQYMDALFNYDGPLKGNRSSGYWLVLWVICWRPKFPEGTLFMSINSIANAAKLSKKQARRHMKEIVLDGWILPTSQNKGGYRQNTNHYRLNDELFKCHLQGSPSISDQPNAGKKREFTNPVNDHNSSPNSPNTTALHGSQNTSVKTNMKQKRNESKILPSTSTNPFGFQMKAAEDYLESMGQEHSRLLPHEIIRLATKIKRKNEQKMDGNSLN